MVLAPVKTPYFGTSFDAKSAKKDGFAPVEAACHSLFPQINYFHSVTSFRQALCLFSIHMRQAEFLSYFRILKGTYLYESLRY